MPEINNRIRNGIREYARSLGITFYNEHAHEGQLRTLILRSNHKGEIMLIVVWADEPDMRVMEYLRDEFPEIISLLYVVNRKFNDTIGDQEVHVFHGQDHIMEQMEDLQFKVGPKSFYQTNTLQAYELYKVARNFAGLTGNELVFDLYTGTGTIANFVAHQARQVIGIEYVPEAIEDAKVNSEINGIRNTVFYAGDMKKVLSDEFVEANGRPNVVILDPPRAGVDEPVIDVILRAAPDRIVYVSCNPATQARDIALMDGMYRVESVQPVDMFPHTYHVENVVKLVKR
jgi:23S rRNA (uracil1939-C5)-methyltransferase